MTFDYERQRKISERLIKSRGREITLVRPSEEKANSDRPWKGPKVPPDPDGNAFRLTVPGIQLLPNQVRIFGLSALGESGKLDGLIQISELIFIVFQGENDLRQFTFVEDGGVNFHIQTTQSLKPADVTLLGFIGVRR